MMEAQVSEKEEWFWWAGEDEERYTVGPCVSRGDAISEAITTFGGSPFNIIEAKEGSIDWRIIDADWLAESFDEANNDVADGEGDPPSTEVKDDDWSEIASRLNNTLEQWGRSRPVHAYKFAATRACEHIDPTVAHGWAELDSDARLAVLDLIKQMRDGDVWFAGREHVMEPLIEATNPVAFAVAMALRHISWRGGLGEPK